MFLFLLLKFDLNNEIDASKSYPNELIISGSFCYIEELDQTSACVRENKTLLSIEPNGVFKFASDSLEQTIRLEFDQDNENESDKPILVILNIVRDFGSLTSLNISYSMVSSSGHSPDFYFDQLSRQVEFAQSKYSSSFTLVLNRVHLTNPRYFYVFLTNSQISLNKSLENSPKFAKYNYMSRLTLLPSNQTEFENVFGFVQNSLVVTCALDQSYLTVWLLVLRLGARSTRANVSVGIKSVGYGEEIPEYIESNYYQVGSPTPTNASIFVRALVEQEFEQVDDRVEFQRFEQSYFNYSVNINTKWSSEFNYTLNSSSYQLREFFIYLRAPSKDASLVELPNSLIGFSPYIRVELRKLAVNSSDLRSEFVRVGFVNSTSAQRGQLVQQRLNPNPLNVSVYLEDYNFTYTYTLDWPRLNRSRLLESYFHLKVLIEKKFY